ncbi:hypothetical protein [Bacillus sp. KH172YL63]|uniref:hypothetical protein n=1 Tax=Bacillus sp. KH172YL63 TaxID=2709784 RepID=UPI0013E4D09D|nr:hypothetical protein [Bacillus sp. KH172YL63]BCB04044.1 putative lipoprotein YdeJ [Bacillus sp. KH172YL63]
MKKIVLCMILVSSSAALFACGGESAQTGSEEQHVDEPEKEVQDNEESVSEEPDSVDLEDALASEQSESTEDPLSSYSAEKIGYARVWMEVTGNRDVGELHVSRHSAEEQMNPYDDGSVAYPEDVIVLSGSISADGIVTYSGNGDGTINVYPIPSHWPSPAQIEGSMKDYTKTIIEEAELVSVGAGENEDIIELIGKLKIDS